MKTFLKMIEWFQYAVAIVWGLKVYGLLMGYMQPSRFDEVTACFAIALIFIFLGIETNQKRIGVETIEKFEKDVSELTDFLHYDELDK